MDRDSLGLDNINNGSTDMSISLANKNNIELDDIEKTLKNINLSYLNDNNELVESSKQEMIAPLESESKQLFDMPKIGSNKEELEFGMPLTYENSPVSEKNRFDFSPLINSMVNDNKSIENFKDETKNDSQNIIDDIEKNKEIIIEEIRKINDQIFIPARETGMTNSEYLKDIALKSQIINETSVEFEELINNFVAKIKQKDMLYENSDELSAFRI